ncbi:MAG TPA: hypothetical protein VFY04_00070 [Solirubrobacterales bacterium]|nr:hypothetical protein [Solirubrobacterales bacterium]
MGSSRLVPLARAHWHWLLPAAVIFALLAPTLFSDRTFSTDWGNHMWLLWVQGLNLRDLGEPSYFLQSSLGVLYPLYAFYGGTMYAALGAVSWATSPVAAVAVAYGAALAAAYLGWTWIARLAGVEGWRAQLPGCIAVTAPLAVTNLYGRGDIPEVIATSFIPLVLASGIALFRAPRVHLGAAAAYVVSVAVLTGTHTLTLAWGTVFLVICAALLLASHWDWTRERLRRGLALSGLTALGIGINAWILMPLVIYHTRLVEQEPDPIGLTEYTDPDVLFSIFRDAPDPPVITADVDAQLPVLALLWALVCGALYWRLLSAARRRLALGVLALGGALLALVLEPSLIEDLPKVLAFIQFPYRIVTYVTICVVGLVTLALAAMQREGGTSRLPVLGLAAIAAFNVGLSIQQNSEVRSWLEGRDEALASSVEPPPTWYASLQFADGSAPVVEPTLPPLEIPVRDRRDVYAASYPAGKAGTAETNIAVGDYLVDVSGGEPVGRTDDGRMVLRLPGSPDRPRTVEVKAAWGPAIEVGRWLTVLSLLVAVAGAVAWAIVGRRRRPEG